MRHSCPEKMCAAALNIFALHFLYGLMFFRLLGEIVAKYKTMHLKLSFKIRILPHLFTKVLGNYDEGFVFNLWKQKRKYFVLYVYFA